MGMSEFDDYLDSYEAKINEAIAYTGKSRDFFTEVKARCLVDLFTKQLPERSHPEILDVGCGTALIHPFLINAYPRLRLTGVDVAAATIETARKRNPQVRYDLYEGHELPYRAEMFDAAYAVGVMHHVPPSQWQAFLQQMRRVVRPGGLIAVIEHNPLNPLTRWLVNACPFDRNAVLLGATKLSGLMRDIGLSYVSRRFILFTPFDAVFFRRVDRALGWLPLGAQYLVVGRRPSIQ